MNTFLLLSVWLAADALLLHGLCRIGTRTRTLSSARAAPESRETSAAIHLCGGRDAPARAHAGIGPALSTYRASVALDAKLLLSELVTNSVIHGGADEREQIEVYVRAEAGSVHVEVVNPRRPFERHPEADRGRDGGGRGLQIVDTVAARWGIEQDRSTRAWFELDPG